MRRLQLSRKVDEAMHRTDCPRAQKRLQASGDPTANEVLAAARPLRRKAVITVEFDAEDYFCAQAQEGEIRRILATLRPDFERIDIRFADRRPRLTSRAAPPQATWPRP